MNMSRETLGAFVGLLVTLAMLGWYWGARRQAVERSCIELKAADRTFNGGIVDSITRGWDWPIHWMSGTQAARIPCKGGGTYVE